MEYSKAEIDYVDYCVKNLPDCRAGKRKCPIYESCNEDEECQQLCNKIVDSMKNGEVLSKEDVKIIEFFTTKGLWEPDESEKACHAKGVDEPCEAFAICAERNEGHEVCTELIQRLDLNAQKIAEKEIQKAILRNFPDEWGLEEKLVLVDSERPIPEINGRIDILLKGETTASLFIVELKLRATREHVGQLASYVGWCMKQPMPEQTKAVKGILLAEDFDKGALSALEACPDLIGKICKLCVEIENIQQV